MPTTPPKVSGAIRTFVAAAAIAAFARCYVDSSGYAAVCTAQQKSIGVTDDAVASAGDAPILLNHMTGTTWMTASEAISVGARVYAAASGKVAASGSVFEGWCIGTAATADGDIIEVVPATACPILESVTVAASSAITNTTTETSFGQTLVLAANTLKVGDVIEIEGQGIATSTNSTDTLTVKPYIGSTQLATTGAVDVANNDIFTFKLRLVVRTVGASGTFVVTGSVALGASGTVTEKSVFVASTTIDTTAAQTIDVKATWSVASASNSVRMDIFRVRRIFGAAA